jgi:ketosteroid isomerase-like protein
MSQENVETLRRVNDAFNRGDIEAFIALCAEEIEVEDFSNAPDVPRISRGLSEVRGTFEAWMDAFDEFRGNIVEYIDSGDRVACVVDYVGRSRATGLTVNQRVVDIWEFRAGKFFRGSIGHTDRKAALEAAGLSEQDAHADGVNRN